MVTMPETNEVPIPEILNGLEIYRDKRDDRGAHRTCYHLARKLRRDNPSATDHQLAPHLQEWCNYNELDYDTYIVKTGNLLDGDHELHAPVYDAIERLQNDAYRVERKL